MPFAVRCPHCRAVADVSRTAVGQSVQCKHCAKPFPIPLGSGDLVVEWGVPLVGTRVPLSPGAEMRIGRADDNDLVLPGAGVSRYHCKLVFEADAWNVVDLDSGNGTYVDGQRVQKGHLENDVSLLIGDFVVRVRIPTSPGYDTSLDRLAQPAPVTLAPMADAKASTILGGGTVQRPPRPLAPRARPRAPAQPHPPPEPPELRHHKPAPSPRSVLALKIFVAVLAIALLFVVLKLLLGIA